MYVTICPIQTNMVPECCMVILLLLKVNIWALVNVENEYFIIVLQNPGFWQDSWAKTRIAWNNYNLPRQIGDTR